MSGTWWAVGTAIGLGYVWLWVRRNHQGRRFSTLDLCGAMWFLGCVTGGLTREVWP